MKLGICLRVVRAFQVLDGVMAVQHHEANLLCSVKMSLFHQSIQQIQPYDNDYP